MTKILTVHTHAIDEQGRARHFQPGDSVPDWAAKQLTNPKLFAADDSQAEPERVPVEAPSRSGPGSGKDAWTAFAEASGVGLDAGMTRDDIMAACEAAGVVGPAE